MKTKPTYKVFISSLVLIAFTALGEGSAAQAGERAVAVGAQYDTSHVYVTSDAVNRFVDSFIATFGGQSTKQVVATVTPTPSSTTSQLIQTPVGTISVFGFNTPIPYPFGIERNGYLVTDMDKAVASARAAGADVIVTPFPDPIGRDAVVQLPGGVNLQLYWHTTPPTYAAFAHLPENRVYVSSDRVAAFVKSFIKFSHGRMVADEPHVQGAVVGQSDKLVRRIRIESTFGKMVVFVTDGHLPWPYGRETTGYEVDDVKATLAKAEVAGVKIVVPPFTVEGITSTVVQFPGGYVAEIHGAPNAMAATISHRNQAQLN